MDWKDTVINQAGMKKHIDWHFANLVPRTSLDDDYPALWNREVQAEASFKAGYDYRHIEDLEIQDILMNALGVRLEEREAGRREVIEWIESHHEGPSVWCGSMERWLLSPVEWERQKEEWGL